jgi:DNA-binding SARP family transcriptional activator/Tfp pilus assembly protein PilF
MLAGSPQYRLLGPLHVLVDGREVLIPAAKQRILLATLLLHANTTVTTEALVNRLWDDPPPGARDTVRAYVMRLRKLIDARDAIVTTPSGYLLRVQPHQVDVLHVRDLIAEPRGLHEAWSLWRGPALSDVPSESLRRDELPALEELRLHVLTRRIDEDLALGRHAELVDELHTAVAEHPLHEGLAGQLMLALFRSGRADEATDLYDQLRDRLADELGADPGHGIQALYQQILAEDKALVPRQLPAAPRRFTGRVRELAELGEGGAFVISAIGGVGGVGKTWLALHWAHRNGHRFPDGQLYVNLRGFDPTGPPMDPSAALRSFLAALGVDAGAVPRGLDAQSALFRSLAADKRLLVVLDNARDSEQVAPLLPGGTSTTVITSRSRLATLVDSHGATLLSLDALSVEEARQLLVVWLGTDRIDAEPAAVAELIDCCGGLPLALGIVAARALAEPAVPLAESVRQLRASTPLDALDDEELDLNLRAVFECSYRALSPSAAEVFRLLGVAPGPDIGLAAARSLVGHDPVELAELESAHLVQRSGDRYRMHDLVRLYAAEQAAGVDTSTALHRLVDFYMQTLRGCGAVIVRDAPAVEYPDPLDGCLPKPIADAESALMWFTAEQHNLNAGQKLASAVGWDEHVWLMARDRSNVHYRFGMLREELASCQLALSAAERLARKPLTINAHRMLGMAYAQAQTGETVAARHHLTKALELAEQTGDLVEQSLTHRRLSWAHEFEGNHQAALRHAIRHYEIFAASGDPYRNGRALNAVGWCRALAGDLDKARADCLAALELQLMSSDWNGRAATLDSLGFIAHRMGDSRQALDYLGQAIAIFRDRGDSYQQPDTLFNIGDVHRDLGDAAEARRCWQEALGLYRSQYRNAKVELVEQRLRELADDGRR